GDDRAEILTGFVDAPSDLVILASDLHGALVLVPAADSPDVVVARQLGPNIRGVDLVPGACSAVADEDHLQPAVGHRVHLIVEVRIVWRDAEAGHAGLEEPGITSVSIPAILPPGVRVVVADRREVWEIASENTVDRLEELARILVIVEVALVKDQMGAFGLDELEDASEARA